MNITNTIKHTTTSRRRLALTLAGASLVFAACGGSDSASEPAAEPAPVTAVAEPAAEPAAIGAPAVATATTSVGDVLVDAAGLTLYGFTTDVDGNPTCNDGCAAAWPPLIVEGTDVPAGLDTAVFSVVPRDDGSNQLKAGEWPLYTFAGDAAPGEVNGQGSGDVWFAATPTGGLIDGPQGLATPDTIAQIDSAGEGY